MAINAIKNAVFNFNKNNLWRPAFIALVWLKIDKEIVWKKLDVKLKMFYNWCFQPLKSWVLNIDCYKKY
jgi:hypothetical protein